MIRIRWSPAAAQDLEEICQYLREHHPSFVHSTVRKIYEAVRSLKQFPNRGIFRVILTSENWPSEHD